MKYGIQAQFPNHVFMYVDSTRFGRPSLCDDMSNMALFAQEQNAIDAVKEIRKNGKAPENCELVVVGIEFSVKTVTEVPLPVAKKGFMLFSANEYFIGTKSKSTYSGVTAWGNIERAAVFETRAKLENRRASLLEEAQVMVDYERQKQYHRHGYHRESVEDFDERKFRDVMLAEQRRERIRGAEVREV